MIKQDNKWLEVEWQVALEYIVHGLRHIAKDHGAEQIGALATANSTMEELYLLQKLMRGIGSNNVDFRLRQSDFSADSKMKGAPWLGFKVADISRADRILIVGSFLRKDHPLLASRIRQAVKRGAQVSIIHSADDDLLMKIANKTIVAPSALVDALSQVSKGVETKQATGIAGSLLSGERVTVLLGNFAQQHPQAAQLQMLAQHIATATNGKFGFLGESANSVGGYLANSVPGANGLNAAAMLANPRKAYLLLNVEPELDMANPQQAIAAMKSAEMVVAMSAYKHCATDYADVLLPIAPYSETSGTFVSTEGRVQSFKGAVKPLGDARPVWKVLRVLGNMLLVNGFDFDTSEAVAAEALAGADVAARLNNELSGIVPKSADAITVLQRVSDVPIYATDAIVRRSAPLQATADAAEPHAILHSDELKKLGVQAGDLVVVSQGQGSVRLKVAADDKLPRGVARVAAGHASTAALGAMFGTITVERA
jgi:NADH-quinone oxidoreductase subunit G